MSKQRVMEQPAPVHVPSPDIMEQSKRYAETYAVIRLEQKRSDLDPEDVFVAVNGEALQLQRGKLIPLPMPFVDSLRNAKYPTYTQEAGQDRKISGEVSRFPFSLIAKVSKGAYLALKAKLAEGRDLTDADVDEAMDLHPMERKTVN